jgi:hypothetical protein
MVHLQNNSHAREPELPVPPAARTARRMILAAPIIAAMGFTAAQPSAASTVESTKGVTMVNGKTGEIIVDESTDARTAVFLSDPKSLTRTALSAAIDEGAAALSGVALVGIAALDNGGVIPEPLRVPALTSHMLWPNERSTHRIIWGDGDTAYSVGMDRTLRKTTNSGTNWVVKNKPSTGPQVGYRDCFIVSPTVGELFALRNDGTFTTHQTTAY